jgi:hypothetical protein
MAVAYRELYCPAHFGNTYEVMDRRETEDLLREAKWWGYNVYSDWFDTADLKNPRNNPRNEFLMPQALFERKIESFQIATAVGLETALVITPNHVWLDQMKPEWEATYKPGKIFGQLLCPSIPEARRVILDNARFLFQALAAAKVELSSLSACPYDYGGCACDKCDPWILTFARLTQEIHAQAQEFFPRIKLRLAGWWWSAEDHALFKTWAEKNAPGLFCSLTKHLKYGEAKPQAEAALPEGCESHYFIHIGYPEQRSNPADIYGIWGPVVAPKRIPRTLENLRAEGGTGFLAYSEGFFDDINKALLAGLASGKFSSAQEVLESYTERYFGVSGQQRQDLATALAQWGQPFDVTMPHQEFLALASKAKMSWRLAQVVSKTRLFEIHRQVKEMKTWDARRLALAREFLDEQSRLYRDVWKLGLVRHVLHPRFSRPEWYADWQRHAGDLPKSGDTTEAEA